MAKERVQVQGLGGAVPGIQPTIQRAGQYSVAQVRAPRNKLMDLADALGQVNPALQSYGQIQEFQFQEGAERGAMEASTVDLEQSIEGLDATGEKLVEQGLLPRSQLVGYQRAFRKRIGQRQARTTYFKALNDRLNEVTQNLDSDADIIDSIIAEEKTKAMEQIGGSQFALQGFADYSEAIENNFFTNATKKRDRAVQDYNESMVIEDANDTFPNQILEANVEEDYKDFEDNLKTWMEERSLKDRIPRSRMVELIWNGMAKTAVSDLLFQKQPDKAEKILNAITDVDLTGEGGKLGNINRPNAEIRKETLGFKSQIQQVREAIKADVEFDANDIMTVFNAALHPIVDGPIGIKSVDDASLLAVQAFLEDVGFKGDIEKESNNLMKSGSPNRLLSYARLYFNNDAKRAAYGLALPKMDFAIVQRKERARASLSRDELGAVEGAIKEGVGRGVKAKDILDSYDPSGPITDPAAKAIAARVELEDKENTWFERSEMYPARENEFESGFSEVIQDLYKNMSSRDVSEMVVRETAPFKERYNKLLKEKQTELKGAPNRDEEIIKAFIKIKEEVIGNFRDIKQAEKNYKESFLEEIQEDKKFKVDFLTKITLEKGEEVFRKTVGTYWRYLQQKYAPFAPDNEEQRKQEIIYDVDLDELGKLDIDSRNIAWEKAGVIRSTIEEDTSGDTLDLEDTELLIHRKWGFRNPQEAIDLEAARGESVLKIDFRETPYFETQVMLSEEFNLIRNEWSTYSKLGETERNLDDFPIFKKWNQAFGVLTKEDINTVGLAQADLLKGIQ
jgi:hypothetical protein